jgi:hypothetical protein
MAVLYDLLAGPGGAKSALRPLAIATQEVA